MTIWGGSMLKVVLIDDEPLVIEGMMEMVQWQQFGFKVTGTASDGKSGLKLIMETAPDLVVTDIRMPEMDGLTMIEQCQKQLKKDISFLVFSGYNEFDYIKTAMDLKSLSYILKPIDVDEIHSELQRIHHYFEQIQVKSKRLHENIQLLTQMTLKRILEEPYKNSLIERAEFLLNYQDSVGFCYGVFLGSDDVFSCERLLNEFLTQEKLFENLKYTVLTEHHKRVSVFIYGDYRTLEQFVQQMTFAETIDKVVQERSIEAFIMTDQEQKLENLKQRADSINQRVQMRFYESATLEIIKKDYTASFSKDLLLFDIVKLMEMLRLGSHEDIEHYVNIMTRSIRRMKFDPELLKLRWDAFMNLVATEYESVNLSKDFTTFCEFKESLKNAVAEIERLLTSSSDVILQKIKEYLDRNLDQDLRLKRVAKEFGYNPVYFGQMFLKESGKKYNDYLAHLRIQKAKHILLYSDLSIKEVALQVGYKNPDYFLLKFKEIEGLLPSQYRL